MKITQSVAKLFGFQYSKVPMFANFELLNGIVVVVQCRALRVFCAHFGKAVELSEAELGNVDLHWVYDGEAAVLVLLWDHDCVTALW